MWSLLLLGVAALAVSAAAIPRNAAVTAGLLMVGVAWVFRNRSPYQAGKWFKSGQLFAAAAYTLRKFFYRLKDMIFSKPSKDASTDGKQDK